MEGGKEEMKGGMEGERYVREAGVVMTTQEEAVVVVDTLE